MHGLFEAGSRVSGRYEILSIIGSGGGGCVYKAQDLENDELVVAIKQLILPFDYDETDLIRFSNEARLTKGLSHKNIVKIYEVGETEFGDHFIAMEFIEGQTLRKILEDKANPLSLEKGLFILRDVASALAFAHGKKIVHRDLKPENVLIRRDGTVKVLDFGLARDITPGNTITAPGFAVGTPYYMSPEQSQRKPLDGRTDIYALGIIAFEMAAGKKPFDSEDPTELLLMHIQEPIPLFKDWGVKAPHWFEVFVNACAAKEPAQRFSSMDNVLEILERQMHYMKLIESSAVREQSLAKKIGYRLFGFA